MNLVYMVLLPLDELFNHFLTTSYHFAPLCTTCSVILYHFQDFIKPFCKQKGDKLWYHNLSPLKFYNILCIFINFFLRVQYIDFLSIQVFSPILDLFFLLPIKHNMFVYQQTRCNYSYHYR